MPPPPGMTEWMPTNPVPAVNTWRSGAYGNGMFVVAADVTPPQASAFMSSPDGINWTARAAPVAGPNWAVSFANGLFIANSSGSSPTTIATSTDGINWTSQVVPSGALAGARRTAYGAGLFVTPNSSNAQSMTSPDGINWTLHTLGSNSGWWPIAFGADNQFVCLGTSPTQPSLMTSPDGINWTARAGPTQGWRALVYAFGQYIAASPNSGFRLSTDGINWTNPGLSFGNGWQSIAAGDGYLIAAGNTSTAVAATNDGVTWYNNALPVPTAYPCMYGNGRFVIGIPAGTLGTQTFYYADITPPVTAQPQGQAQIIGG